MAKKRKNRCYCAASHDAKGIRNMVCSRSKKHTRRLASRIGRSGRERYGKVFTAAAGNC